MQESRTTLTRGGFNTYNFTSIGDGSLEKVLHIGGKI